MTENMRRYENDVTIQYKGILITPRLYYKGNTELVHSWDLTAPGYNFSRYAEHRAAVGLTDDDMDNLNAYVARKVSYKEGRR